MVQATTTATDSGASETHGITNDSTPDIQGDAEPSALLTLFVDNLDTLVAQITERGIDPAKRETYSNGVRKITYRAPFTWPRSSTAE